MVTSPAGSAKVATKPYLFLQTTEYKSVPPKVYEANRVYELTPDMIERWNRRGVGTDDPALIQAARNSQPPAEAQDDDASFSIVAAPDLLNRFNVVDKSGKAVNGRPLTKKAADVFLDALGRGEKSEQESPKADAAKPDAAAPSSVIEDESDWNEPITAAAMIKLTPEDDEPAEMWFKGRTGDGTILRSPNRQDAAVADSVAIANASLNDLGLNGEVIALDHARAWVLAAPAVNGSPRYLRHVPAKPDAVPPKLADISLVEDPMKASRYGSEGAALYAGGLPVIALDQPWGKSLKAQRIEIKLP